MTEQSIFIAALDIANSVDRQAYLDQACAGNPELRSQIDELINAHERTGQFMANPAPVLVADDASISEQAGTVIGSYKLLEQIGEGGFGVVFMAEQQKPVRRKVALKVIKIGMDTRQVVARFEAERQALALMDHPNIAKVLDAGATDTGRPFFVMELIKGLPITEYCDQNRFTPKERLELFISVCLAVQHAHQKGLIHRDIKPTNVLVTLIDGVPVVKVIDFGIAKATGQQLTEKTLFTNFAQMIGTPLYMSPEQAALSGVDVDTRSDIYSLGVLLYELLTGTTPFEQARFRESNFDEIRRIIREEEPPKPSTRVSTLAQESTTVSTRRKCDPKSLSRTCRGELDWIVMKALEKDRSRRYETASAMARDIQRHLRHEPIEAGPPSYFYRFGKFARRNVRWLTAAGAVAIALILIGIVLWNRHMQFTANEKAISDDLADAERHLVLEQWDKASQYIDRAKVRSDASGDAFFISRVKERRRELDLISQLDNIRTRVMSLNRFGELGSSVDRDYAKAFADAGISVEDHTPSAVANVIRQFVGRTTLVSYLDHWILVDLKKERREFLRQVLNLADDDQWSRDLRSPQVLNSREKLLELAADPKISDRPTAHQITLVRHLYCRLNERDAAIDVLRRALDRYPSSFRLNFEIANVLGFDQGEVRVPAEFGESIHYLHVAVALRPDHFMANYFLGNRLMQNGEPAIAEKYFRKAIAINPNDEEAHQSLAQVLMSQGKKAEAMNHTRIANDLASTILRTPKDDKSPETNDVSFATYFNRGATFNNGNRFQEAETCFREAKRIKPENIYCRLCLADVLDNLGKLREAESEFRGVIKDAPGESRAYRGLGAVLGHQGRYIEAVDFCQMAIKHAPKDAEAFYELGANLFRIGKVTEGIMAFQRCLELAPEPHLASSAYSNLSKCYHSIGDFDWALAYAVRGADVSKGNALSKEALMQAKGRIRLGDLLPDYLSGKVQPINNDERLLLADVCFYRRYPAAATQFYRDAFKSNPKCLEEHRYGAACAAVLAGCGSGKDALDIESQPAAELREQAHAWLCAELAASRARLKEKSLRLRQVHERMIHFQTDPDLNAVRDEDALSLLPEKAERVRWRLFWADVEAVLKSATPKQ